MHSTTGWWQGYRAACLLALIGTLVLGGYAIVRHERLNSSTYDLGIKDQVIWNTSQGRWFASSVEVGHYLGDHVQLIFVPLALLYRIWPSPHLLLVLQSAGLAAGAIPLYGIARDRLQRHTTALMVAGLYLLYPAVGFINRFDFHAVSFSIPLFLWAYWALERRHMGQASLAMLLALCCREEVGLTVSAFGVYVLLARSEKRWGALWTAVGATWSLIALFWIIPSFRGTASDTLGRYGWLGDSALDMLRTLLTQPGYVLQHQFVESPFRWQFLLRLFLPLGFLPFLSPALLAVGLPSLAYNLLADRPAQSSIYFQYVSLTVPFLHLAAVEGQSWLGRRFRDLESRRRVQWMCIAAMVCCTLIALLIDNPLTKTIRAPYYEVYGWEQVLDRQAFRRVARQIPSQAPLTTMMAYGPHLSHRRELHLFYDKGARGGAVFRFPQTEYLLLNVEDMRWRVNPRLFYTMIETAVGWYDYEVIALDGDIALLQQGAPPHPGTADLMARSIAHWDTSKFAPVSEWVIEDIRQLALRETLPPGHTSFDLSFGEQIDLVGARVTPAEMQEGGERVVTVSLYWQTQEPIEDSYILFVHITDATGWVHAQRDTESGWGFYPTSTWPIGTLIEDVRCLPLPPGLPPGEYRVRVGWYTLPDVQRLPVTEGNEFVGDVVDVGTFLVRQGNDNG